MSTVKSNEVGGASIWSELFQTGLYKRSQGRIARQLTFAALAIAVGLGCWRLAGTLEAYRWVETWAASMSLSARVTASVVGLAAFVPLIWLCYRVVNMPRFAEFLIAVEAEMNKVSWPGRTELIRASIVVLLTILLLAATLFIFDLIWEFLFVKVLGITGGVKGAG